MSPTVTKEVYDVIMKTTNLSLTGEYLIYIWCKIRLWRIRLYRQFAYNDAFSSVPEKFLSFTCIWVRLYRHFACSDAFWRSSQNNCSL